MIGFRVRVLDERKRISRGVSTSQLMSHLPFTRITCDAKIG